MDETPGLSDQYRTASPWPVFVALGIPLSELGILFDVFALAVGGLVLFCGSVAGMLQEAGYVETPWRALGAMAVLLLSAGAVLLVGVSGFASRGTAVVVAGGLMLVAGVAGELFATGRAVPA
ncbi:MAG: cox cluster protein [Haloferacaceae archaeon]